MCTDLCFLTSTALRLSRVHSGNKGVRISYTIDTLEEETIACRFTRVILLEANPSPEGIKSLINGQKIIRNKVLMAVLVELLIYSSEGCKLVRVVVVFLHSLILKGYFGMYVGKPLMGHCCSKHRVSEIILENVSSSQL